MWLVASESIIQVLEWRIVEVLRAVLKVLDCAKAQEVEEEETLDFPIILYKRSSCFFVKERLFEVDVEPSAFVVSKLCYPCGCP